MRGLVRSAEVEGAIGEIINLGTGQEISIGELALQITSLMNRDIKVVSDEQRLRPSSSEVHRLCCNSGKADRLLGWRRQYSLEEGLRETIGWLKESAHLEESKRYHI